MSSSRAISGATLNSGMFLVVLRETGGRLGGAVGGMGLGSRGWEGVCAYVCA
mgnify:CR=1 FL=1